MIRSGLLTLLVLAPAAFASGPPKLVDLDRPGALEALAVQNPAHHRRALELIRIAEQPACKQVPKVRRSKDEPADPACAPSLLMTSHPPKRLVTFTIDDTHYQSVVTVRVDARLMPAK